MHMQEILGKAAAALYAARLRQDKQKSGRPNGSCCIHQSESQSRRQVTCSKQSILPEPSFKYNSVHLQQHPSRGSASAAMRGAHA